MSSLPLYLQLSEQLSQFITPKDRRHLQVFSELIGAILMSGSACMSHWTPFLSHRNCKARSHLERISYFLKNSAIDSQTFYEPLLQFFLHAWQGKSMTLVLDTSMQWDKFCLIQVCLAWGGRSIPIAHEVLEHGSATVGFDQYLPVLKAAQALLPKDVQVTFLADRGFEHGELIRWLNQQGWDWAIRAKCDLLIDLGLELPPQAVATLKPLAKVAFLYPDVKILGDINCHFAIANCPEAKETWAIVTSIRTTGDIFRVYGGRFGGIEPHFKDHKSGAFNLPKSRLRHAQALSCLFLLMATAQILAISIGFWMDYNQQRSRIDAHTRRGLSFLQLGLRQIKSLCHLQQSLPDFSALPYCNPPPAYASRQKQSLQATRHNFSQVWEFDF
jgi:hypothetical protein